MAERQTAISVSQSRNGAQRALLVIGLPGLALGLPLGVYLLTLAPSVYSLDSPELVTAAYTLGVAHAPGYPLYTLLGWLFSHAVPVGDVAFRLNLMSALLGAAAVLLVYFVARRLTGDALASLVAALLLGFSYWFWANSLVAEVYTLDAFLLAAMLLLLVEWRQGQQKAALFAFALFFGLSLANRTTSALFAPAFAAYLLVSWRGADKRSLLAMPAFLAAGLLFYIYIPAVYRAGPSYVWSTFHDARGHPVAIDLASIHGLWWLVSARAFQGLAFAYGPVQGLEKLGESMWWLTASFMGVGLALGLIGIWRQFVTSWRELLLLGGILLPQLIFYSNYGVADREFMLLPVYVVWAVWVAIGVAFVARLARSYAPRFSALAATPALLLALPLVALAVNYQLVDLSSEHRPREEATALFAVAEPNAMIVGRWIDVSPMLYLQKVEHQRPDVILTYASSNDELYLWNIARMNVGKRAVYMPEKSTALATLYDFEPVGRWYEVKAKGDEQGGR